MLKDTMLKLKEKIQMKEKGNNKKLIENLVIFIVILIVTIVIINYIWNEDDKKEKSKEQDTKVLATKQISEDIDSTNLNSQLETILSKIKGVGNVNVLVTYSQTSQTLPMYSEDVSQTTTEETDAGGGKRTVNENTNRKEVVYEEKNGIKTPIKQSIINPKIEGAIITAQGAEDSYIKASIIQAVEAATGLPTHKIQVFTMD